MTLATTTAGSDHALVSPSPDRYPASSPPMDQLKGSVQQLLGALAEKGVNAAVDRVERLSGKLEDVARSGGPVLGAAGGGLRAVVAGRNPVWGAAKGAIVGLSMTTKVLVVLALVLGLLLGPVVLVVLLLALLVLAVIAAVRSSAPPP